MYRLPLKNVVTLGDFIVFAREEQGPQRATGHLCAVSSEAAASEAHVLARSLARVGVVGVGFK